LNIIIYPSISILGRTEGEEIGAVDTTATFHASYKSKSIYPCIISHMFVNGTSVLSLQGGPYTQLINQLFNYPTPQFIQMTSAFLIIAISGTYALWLWKKA